MRSRKRIAATAVICIVFFALAYFALYLPFYKFGPESYATSLKKVFSIEYIKTILPLFIITVISTLGIILTDYIRNAIMKKSRSNAYMYSKRGHGNAPTQKPALFMILRWLTMILFSFMMIWGGLLFGLRSTNISLPVFSCPADNVQMTESSCYFLSHPKDLFEELPLKNIIIFYVSTLLFIVLLGRVMCGFLCPMGLIQDVMDKLRKKTKVKGISPNEKMYSAFVPIKWFMVLLFFGIGFIGGNFCNFCPAITVSPILAGIGVSLYVSGFLMIFVLIGGFFKRRLFCNICPLGFIVGLFHKVSLFRIRKDCQACTECGACYEACPMGIKTIYTEREKTDVTEASCIMCGECIRCCPEDNALSLTCAGKKLFTASRKNVMSGYAPNRKRG